MAAPEAARILIAMDGSKHADDAFQWYLTNVMKPTDYVILFHSIEYHSVANMPMGVGSADLLNSMLTDEKEQADKYLTSLTEKMRKANLHGKVKQMHGPARTEIIVAAEEEGATMVIMGTRGMGKVRRTVIGSVSDHVLHHCHVPVLICKFKDSHHHHH